MHTLFICSGVRVPQGRVCRHVTVLLSGKRAAFSQGRQSLNLVSQRGSHIGMKQMVHATIVASSAVDHVSYTVRCKPHPLEFGQSLAIVSNVHDWDVGSAVTLGWKEGDLWEGIVDVPVDAGVFEFKLVTVADDGVLEWEGSENKVVKVFKKDVKKGASVECEWNSGNVMVVSADGKTKKTAPKKKKPDSVTEPVSVVEEPVSVVEEPATPKAIEEIKEIREDTLPEPIPEAVVEPVLEPKHEEAIHQDSTPEVYNEGDVVTYSFDGSGEESAAEMAKRMYG
jgi:hypothetical protein